MTILNPNPIGRQLADAGIAAAQDHAESRVYRWTDQIMAEFGVWLAPQKGRFAVEDFRDYIEHERPDLMPPSPQAWGVVGRLICNQGLARFVGYRPARSRATRNHPVRIFVRMK